MSDGIWMFGCLADLNSVGVYVSCVVIEIDGGRATGKVSNLSWSMN